MKIIIILNGISRWRTRFYRDFLPPLQKEFAIEVLETQYGGHAESLTQQAEADVILAAGGDGTLHEVINGTMKRSQQPALGIIPLGSGNDFARTCGIKAEAKLLLALLRARSFQPTDVGRIQLQDINGKPIMRYFINACSAGMGPQVLEILQQRPKQWGGSFNYFSAIVQTFFTYQYKQVEVRTDRETWSGPVRVLAFANGKSFGNQLTVAPDADLNDGLFNTFIASRVSLFDFLRFQGVLKRGHKIVHPHVHYGICDSASLTSTEPVAMEADGEWAGMLPAKIEVMEKKILFCRK